MKKDLTLKISCLIFLFSNFTNLSRAQNSRGKEFWVGFMESVELPINGYPTFTLIATTERPTILQVYYSAFKQTDTFQLLANEIREIKLRDTLLYPIGSDVSSNKSVKVISTEPIQLVSRTHRLYFSESSIVLPISELGKDYIFATFKEKNPSTPGIGQKYLQSALIIGTEDSTIVLIEPSDSVLTLNNQNKKQPYQIRLNAGEVYQLQSEKEMTGSLVKANKKVSIFIGARYLKLDSNDGINPLYEQLPPLNTHQVGKNYAFVPFARRSNAYIRVVAIEDNTSVYLDCLEINLKTKGGFKDFIVDKPTLIQSTKNIFALQIMRSAQLDFQSDRPTGWWREPYIGDPNLLFLQPLNLQSKKAATYYRVDTGRVYAYVNIVISSNATHSFYFNGKTLVDSFRKFPFHPQFSYARLPFSVNKNTLSSDSGFIAYTYSLGNFDATTENLGYDFVNTQIAMPEIVPPFPLSLNLFPDSICNGDTLRLNPKFDFTFDRLTWIYGDNNKSSTLPLTTVVQPDRFKKFYVQLILNRDYCLETMSYSKSIAIKECKNNNDTPCDFYIFPNPFSSSFSIKSQHSQSKNLGIEIFSIDGRSTSSQNIFFNPNGISQEVILPNASGSYILRISKGEKQYCHLKIIKTD
jgi:hypothetical protein